MMMKIDGVEYEVVPKVKPLPEGHDMSVDIPDEDEEFVTTWTEEREWAAKGQEVKKPFDPEKIKVYLDGIKPAPPAPFDPGQDSLWQNVNIEVVHPGDVSSQPHYTVSAIQPIDYINANGLDFLEGNIVKYVTRWRHKNGLEDLEKLVDYAKRLLTREQARSDD